MNAPMLATRVLTLGAALAFATGCGASPAPAPEAPPAPAEEKITVPAPPPLEAPPASGPTTDIQFPPRQTVTLPNGLVIDVVHSPALPIVQMQLVIKSGRANDPKGKPGVAAMVAEMLTLGAKNRSAESFAEAIEFLGADLSVWEEPNAVRLQMRALSEHLEPALGLLSDALLAPKFSPKELEKLRRHELGRLKLSKNEAGYLAKREFNRALYGEHPYANVDTTEAVLKKLTRADLSNWHKTHFKPGNAFMVVVGDVTAEQIEAAVTKKLGKWRDRPVKTIEYPAPPLRTAREVLVVDRPESVQSVIYIGSTGIRRSDEVYIPLKVANQVLGGSAASRLFMDLREKRSLTYGAYSRFDSQLDVGLFKASAAVRNAVTAEAVGAFLEHLERIVAEPAPAAELDAAHRYLADSFPLKIETAARVANLLADQRFFGLPADYWDTYRSSIRAVDTATAHNAAKAHIDASKVLILVVGKAAEVVPGLRQFGPVRVVDAEGKTVTTFDVTPEAAAPAAAPATAPAEPANAPAATPAKPAGSQG